MYNNILDEISSKYIKLQREKKILPENILGTSTHKKMIELKFQLLLYWFGTPGGEDILNKFLNKKNIGETFFDADGGCGGCPGERKVKKVVKIESGFISTQQRNISRARFPGTTQGGTFPRRY